MSSLKAPSASMTERSAMAARPKQVRMLELDDRSKAASAVDLGQVPPTRLEGRVSNLEARVSDIESHMGRLQLVLQRGGELSSDDKMKQLEFIVERKCRENEELRAALHRTKDEPPSPKKPPESLSPAPSQSVKSKNGMQQNGEASMDESRSPSINGEEVSLRSMESKIEEWRKMDRSYLKGEIPRIERDFEKLKSKWENIVDQYQSVLSKMQQASSSTNDNNSGGGSLEGGNSLSSNLKNDFEMITESLASIFPDLAAFQAEHRTMKENLEESIREKTENMNYFAVKLHYCEKEILEKSEKLERTIAENDLLKQQLKDIIDIPEFQDALTVFDRLREKMKTITINILKIREQEITEKIQDVEKIARTI